MGSIQNGQTWYRGVSSNTSASPSGGAIHDFGDGVYLADTQRVASMYAKTRAGKSGGTSDVFSVKIDLGKLRVLDLTKDPRWQKYLNEPIVPGKQDSTPKNMIKSANENYGRMFKSFLKKNNINIQQYDVVIGPEYVRGGNQIAILLHNGKPLSDSAMSIIKGLRPISTPAPVRPPKIFNSRPLGKTGRPIKTSAYRRAFTPFKGIAKSQAGAEMLAQVTCKAFEMIGDKYIDSKINKYISTRTEAIGRIHARGEGALVIIKMQEWATADFNQNRAHTLLGTYLSSGLSQSAAMNNWTSTPKLTNEASNEGWRSYEEYIWLPAPEDIQLPHSSVSY